MKFHRQILRAKFYRISKRREFYEQNFKEREISLHASLLAALFDLRSARQIDKFAPRVSASADARSENPRVKFTDRSLVLAPLYP